MTYADYLDYWMSQYFEINFKYSTAKRYKETFKIIKAELGKYMLYSITPYLLNQALLEVLKSYQHYQINNRKKQKTKYYDYYLEEAKNKYGKVVENRIIELKYKSKKKAKVNLVFVKDNGIYIGTDLISYPYRIIHHELGINNCRFYDLRRSFSTKSLKNGVEIRDVADILGHSKIEATKNYYVTTTKETDKEASEKFEEMVKLDSIDEIIKYK